jgi:NADH-quinone oxidoreductase subunit J
MTFAFYIAAGVAIISTFMVITRSNAVHALLYLVVSLLSVALIFLLLGAPFVAALEVIIYGGAIMVLFVFVVMMLSMGPRAVSEERQWMTNGAWIGPSILTAVLAGELIYLLHAGVAGRLDVIQVSPRQVAQELLGPYLLGVELASMLLLLGLVGANHLAYGLRKRRAGAAAQESR